MVLTTTAKRASTPAVPGKTRRWASVATLQESVSCICGVGGQVRAELVATTSVSVPKCEREEEGEREHTEEE